jgi:hypothetical protein
LTPCHDIDHKIEVVPKPRISFFKATYRLKGQKNLNQINELIKIGYIKPSKLLYGTLVLFVGGKKKRKL